MTMQEVRAAIASGDLRSHIKLWRMGGVSDVEIAAALGVPVSALPPWIASSQSMTITASPTRSGSAGGALLFLFILWALSR